MGLVNSKMIAAIWFCTHVCENHTSKQVISIHTVLLHTLYTFIISLTGMFYHYHLSIKIIFGVSIAILSMKKKISYAYFWRIVKWHIGNVFNKPPRQNAPTDSVLSSVILKGIEWAFRKVYPTKIPGMVHQGLLAPQSLVRIRSSDTCISIFSNNEI